MPFFSIIIPLYNKEAFIENTIKSVLSQTFTDFEVIVVNDGSTDKSLEKINGIKDSRILISNQENSGASATRNKGLTLASSDYIAFLDADDLWLEDHLQTLYTLIQDFPQAGIFASRYQLVFKNNHVSIPEFKDVANDFRGIISDYFESSLNYAVATSSSIVVPSKIFKELGHFKTYISSGQDTDMWLRIALKYPVAISDKVTASYLHFIDNSLSKTSILDKKIKQFSDYQEDEKQRPSLKHYLDLYRMEYALQYKIAGEQTKSEALFKDILLKNVSWKSKMLYRLPRFVLVQLLNFKRFLRNMGIDFSVYN